MNLIITYRYPRPVDFKDLKEGECFQGTTTLGESIIGMKTIGDYDDCINLQTGLKDEIESNISVNKVNVRIEYF